MAVTGPFTKVQGSLTQPGGICDTMYWYRGGRKSNTPLPYTHSTYRVISSTLSSPMRPGDCITNDGYAELNTTVENKLWKKHSANFSNATAQLGASIGERKQAIQMITTRAQQLATFARQLRRGNIRGAARTLNIGTPPTSGRHKLKTFGDLWLEFHFGWVPLIQDIYDATAAISDGMPVYTSRVSASSSLKGQVGIYKKYDAFYMYTWSRTLSRHSTCDIRISNSDLHLAQTLGLVNPLSVAWELVPFSFVVDWFVNVGDFLGSLTAEFGLSFSRTSVASVTHTTKSITTRDYAGAILRYGSGTGFVMTREVRLPAGPVLAFKPFKGFSPTRGLTAVSLLLQQLR